MLVDKGVRLWRYQLAQKGPVCLANTSPTIDRAYFTFIHIRAVSLSLEAAEV